MLIKYFLALLIFPQLKYIFSYFLNFKILDESELRSVVSDSLWPHRLYSPWNTPGQKTGVGGLSLSRGFSQTQASRIVDGFFTNWATREVQDTW